MVNSFKNPLPWTLCDQSWNSENCVEPKGYDRINGSDRNSTIVLFGNTYGNDTLGNQTGFVGTVNRTVVPSTEEFWL